MQHPMKKMMTPEKRQVQCGKQNVMAGPFQPYSLSLLLGNTFGNLISLMPRSSYYMKYSYQRRLAMKLEKKIKGGKNNAAVIFACCPSIAF